MKNTKKHLYTAVEIFKLIMQQLHQEGKVPDILDYELATNEEYEFRDYGFDILGCVNYGCEGIYLDLFWRGDIGDSRGLRQGEIGTIKTLETSDEAFRTMAVLMADFQTTAHRFVNAHLDDFTWQGFDVDFYRYGSEERCYGVTCKAYRTSEEAVSYAKREMRTYKTKPFDYAVVTNNRSGETEIVGAFEKDELKYFEIWLQENPDEPGGIFDFDICIRAFREPTIEEAEAFLKDDRENAGGPEHILHVTHIEEISYRAAERDFDIPTEDRWPIFGLEEWRTANG